MKRIVVLFVLAMASVSFATDIQIENPALSLDGSTVTMKSDIVGVSPQQIKILSICGGQGGLSENMYLQPWFDMVNATGQNKVTLSEMYSQGWKISQIITSSYTNGSSQNTKIDYIFFVK